MHLTSQSKRFKVVLLFLVLQGLRSANGCPSTDKESLLKPDHDYIYKFESSATSQEIGISNNTSLISLLCDVLISHVSGCVFLLKLELCQVKAAERTLESGDNYWIDEAQPDLSKYPLQFSLINGEVTDIYIHDEDPIHFANIKRAAVSAFVFKLSYTLGDSLENHIDIHGNCPLIVNPDMSSKGFVKTSKNMSACSLAGPKYKESSPWTFSSDNSFIRKGIDSSAECKYNIDTTAKRINVVTCEEKHAVSLEMTNKTTKTVQTIIQYSMKYTGSNIQSHKPDTDGLVRKTNIIFEYENSPKTDVELFTVAAKKILFDIVEGSIDEMKLTTIPQFSEFVELLRKANSLIPFVEEVKSCSFLPETLKCTADIKELAMAFLGDALVQCNSSPCVEAILFMAKSGDFSEAYMSFVFFTWRNMYFRNPDTLNKMLEVCLSMDSDSCHMSLGSILKNFAQSQNEVNNNEKRFNQIQEIARSIYHKLHKYCSINTDENVEILKFLKVINSMGEESMILVPESSKYLTDCLMSAHTSTKTKGFILEVLKNIKPWKSSECCDRTFKKVITILRNSSLPTTLRALSYDYLIQDPQEKFEKEIITVLKRDGDFELKSYIASSLNTLLLNSEFEQTGERFLESLKESLFQEEMSLESFMSHSSTQSFTSVSTMTPFNLPFEHILGLKFDASNIYEQPDALPKYFQRNIVLKFFGKLVNLVKFTGKTDGLEKLAFLFQKALTEFNSETFSMQDILQIFEEILREVSIEGYNLLKDNSNNEYIQENLIKLENFYQDIKPKAFLDAYLNLFGKAGKYFSLQDIAALLTNVQSLVFLADRNTHTYNATRIVQVIDADHNFPTMMGLLLKLSSHATIALSLRSGLKIQFTPETFAVHLRGYVQPSAAMTFLNEMVIDFPSLTKIGIQVNTSAYTSTNLGAQLNYSEEKKVFSILKPNKSQKLLELYHIYQKIKHNSTEDILNSNVDRSTSKTCSGDMVKSITGLEICIEKSYPLVAEHKDPWLPTIGSCKWQLFADLYDKKVTSYDFEIVKVPKDISKELIIRFSTPGSDNEREIFFKRVCESTEEEYGIRITQLPNFSLSLMQTKNADNQEKNTYKILVILQLRRDVSYELNYHDEVKKEEKQHGREFIISFNTPFNKYEYFRISKDMGETSNNNIILSYENLNSSGKWLSTILPQSFWESDSKAWIELQINRSTSSISLEQSGTYSQKMHSFIKIPESTINLIGKYSETKRKEEIHLNITKRSNTNGMMMSSMNFTYKNLVEQIGFTENQVKVVNLTTCSEPLECKSFSIIFNKEMNVNKLSYELSLNTATLKSKHLKDTHIECWHKSGEDDFVIDKGDEVKFMIVTNTFATDSKDLTEKGLIQFDPEKNSLSFDINYLVLFNSSLLFPLYDGKERITLDGYFITSYSLESFRLQNDFVIGSSYNNIELNSHSVYTSDATTGSFDHRAVFTHTGSQKKATNIVKYNSLYSKLSLPDVEFKHEIRSIMFDLFTNVTLKQNSNGEDLHTLLVFINTNSSSWDMLNTSLSQIVEQVNSDYTYETCNFTHPSLIINVTADWSGSHDERKHRKKVVFSSPVGSYDKSELHYWTLGDKKSTLELLLPDKHLLSYERTISVDGKNFMIRINHSQSLDGDSSLEVHGKIVRKDLQLWKLNLNVERMARMGRLLQSGFVNVAQKIILLTKDKSHPLNKVFESTFKTTICDYYQVLSEGNKRVLNVVEGIGERICSIKKIFIEPIEVLLNIKCIVWETTLHVYQFLRKSSILVWLFEYFNVTDCSSLYCLFRSHLILPADQHIHLEFSTTKILHWNSFKKQTHGKVKSIQDIDKNFDISGNSRCRNIQLFIPSYTEFASYGSCNINSQTSYQ